MFVFKGEQLFVYFGDMAANCTIFDQTEQAECAAPGSISALIERR